MTIRATRLENKIVSMVESGDRLAFDMLRGVVQPLRILSETPLQKPASELRGTVVERKYAVDYEVNGEPKSIEQFWEIHGNVPASRLVRDADGISRAPTGLTAFPILDSTYIPITNFGLRDNFYCLFIKKPQPSADKGIFMTEFISGGVREGETRANAARREVKEESGAIIRDVKLLLDGMFFAPFRFNLKDDVVIARIENFGNRKPDYEELPITPHLIPGNRIIELVTGGAIKDFRTVAVLGTFLVRTENGQPELVAKLFENARRSKP